MNIDSLVRKDVFDLPPYKVMSGGSDWIKLNKNESPWSCMELFPEVELNRYPCSDTGELNQYLADLFQCQAENILLSRGSDEAIDLIIRLFCQPSEDQILIAPPTFSVYENYAKINATGVQKCFLMRESFDLDEELLFKTILPTVKVIFLCSPNNPTGNLIPMHTLERLCASLHKIIVVDEAYIEFAGAPSCLSLIEKYSNLIVLRTLSKAYGLAGIRCGIIVTNSKIISYLQKVAAPYLLNVLTQYAVKKLCLLEKPNLMPKITLIKSERDRLRRELTNLKFVKKVWPSSANFLLVKLKQAKDFFRYCFQHKILLRDVTQLELLQDCLRVTIGSPSENNRFLAVSKEFEAL